MLDIEFSGAPDMETLERHAEEAKDAHVRIIWTVDAEHREIFDRKAILEMCGSSAEVKLDGRVNPILRSRTEGITRLASVAQQLDAWAKATDTSATGLAERLALLQSQTAEAIVESIVRTEAAKLKEAA